MFLGQTVCVCQS